MMKKLNSVLGACVMVGLLSGCASPVPKGLQYYSKSITVPKTSAMVIYSRSRTWIGLNEDRYHFKLDFSDAKSGTIVLTGHAYADGCHNVMNDCPFLSYSVLEKIQPEHFTITFSGYRFYLNAQDPGQSANFRQFQQLEPLFSDIVTQLKQAVLLTNPPLRAQTAADGDTVTAMAGPVDHQQPTP